MTAPPGRDPVRFATLGAAVRADVARGLAMATVGCAVLAVVEYAATLWAFEPPTPVLVKLRLFGVTITLVTLVWLLLAPLTALVVAAPRLYHAQLRDEDPRRGAGFLAWPARRDRPPSGAVTLWAVCLVAGAYLFVLQRIGHHALTHYKEKQLIALYIAAAAMAAAPLAYLALRVIRRALTVNAELIFPVVGRFSVLTSWTGALVGLGALAGGALAYAMHRLPQIRPLVPWRHTLALAAIAAGMTLAAKLVSLRPLVPRDRRRRRRVALAAAAAALVLVPAGLLRFGGDHETRSVAVTASPTLSRIIDWLRRANDFDRDGYGSLLGENDCGPFNAAIHPFVRDKPDNGIDENCDGHDFSVRDLRPPKPGEKMAVPRPFQRDWNILLLTVDTVRYDHTTFGGYARSARKRDTTPMLARLVDKSTSFTFASAPSAGTMASVPAILTSKFFHSGIALDEKVKSGMPPRLKPENTLIAEIMKRGNYATGAITSHEYFNDWGMNQGVDDYDNEIGKTLDPFRVTSHLLTDRAITWISRHPRDKWFLWVHYLDPHGRYVAHPDDVDYGSTEEDLYDAELHYTDKHIGRLLDELSRLPGGERTIVVITSDHGDGFNEHGFINHGQALYRELLHVPLIFYVPDNEPRQPGGAVTPLDIVPTVADLCGIDISDLELEGVSLVPQIFYGKEDPERIVFSETNWPKPLRAAISSRYKLVYNLANNIYELFDLRADPWEKNNLAAKDRYGLDLMKTALEAWLERVMYARDPLYNQAAMRMAEALLTSRPAPQHPVAGVTFDDGRIAVLGFETGAAQHHPGDKIQLSLFLEAVDRPSGAFRMQVTLWPVTGAKLDPKAALAPTTRSPMRLTLDGLFPSDRWRPGEMIRERFSLTVPPEWTTGDHLGVGLSMGTSDGKRVDGTGAGANGEPNLVPLGTMPLAPATP